ncbi:MAG: hypothetical protein ACOC10_01320 [Bacteroidota bacterium]
MELSTTNTTESIHGIKDWFDNFVASLRSDQVQLESDIATNDKKNLYAIMMEGDEDKIALTSRIQTSVYFIKRLLLKYLKNIKNDEITEVKLAFNLSDSKIHVWAEINDDDEKTEDYLFLLEARLNAEFEQFGICISSTIVEKSDRLTIPPHYQIFD